MTERMRFIVAVQGGELSMAAACRQSGISRKTGYKWVGRYQTAGVAGLRDQASRARHCPHAVSAEVHEAILALRGRHPTWGPKKLVAKLRAEQPTVPWPALSTVGELLAHAGLVPPRRQRRHQAAHPAAGPCHRAERGVVCRLQRRLRLG